MSFVAKKRAAVDSHIESSDDEAPRTPTAVIPSSHVHYETSAVVVKLVSDLKKWQKEDELAAQKMAEAFRPPAKKPKKVAKTALDVLLQHFDCTPEKLGEILDDPHKVAEAVPVIFCKHFFPVHGGKALFPVIPCGLDRKRRPFQTYDLMFDFLKYPKLPHALVFPAYFFDFQSYSCPLELLYLHDQYPL